MTTRHSSPCPIRAHRLAITAALGLTLGLIAPETLAEPVSFGAMGCGPYHKVDVPAARHYLALENKESKVDFLIHLGDLFHVKPKMPGNKAPASEAASAPAPAPAPAPATTVAPEAQPASDPANGEDLYRDFAQLMTTGNKLPTFIVPGDNEWNDTSNPAQAKTWWEKHLLKLESKAATPQWPIIRQDVRPENFAFVRHGVVFVGLNIVGGRIHDAEEWTQRLTQNAQWLDHVLNTPTAKKARALVIFAQANPFMLGKTDPKDKYDAFFTPMRATAAAWQKPVLYLHADGHKWLDDQPWPEKNIRRVQLERWEVRYPTTQFTIADPAPAADGKKPGVEIIEINRRLRAPEWKVPTPAPAAK